MVAGGAVIVVEVVVVVVVVEVVVARVLVVVVAGALVAVVVASMVVDGALVAVVVVDGLLVVVVVGAAEGSVGEVFGTDVGVANASVLPVGGSVLAQAVSSSEMHTPTNAACAAFGLVIIGSLVPDSPLVFLT